MDGDSLFNLEYEDIQGLDKNTAKSLKKFIEKRKKIDITENKDNKISNIINSYDEKEEKDEINADSENKNKNEYNIQSLSGLSKYNVFIVIALKKDSYHNIKISFFISDLFFKKMLNNNILNVTTFKNLYELFLIQIEFDDIINELIMSITNNKKEELDKKLYLRGIKDVNNYFYFDNFPDTQDKILINIPKNIMFNEFDKYFFDKTSNFGEKYKKDFIRSLIYTESDIRLSGNNILKIMKLSLKYKLELNKIIKYIIFVLTRDSYIEDENLLPFNEIDNLFSNSIVIKLILEIYIFQLKQKEILVEIIFISKYQKEITKQY